MDDYKTHVFDLDGTLLDSNKVKSEAFYRTAQPYGYEAATKFVEFHKTAGSISREARWRYFFKEIVGIPEGQYDYELSHVMDRSTRLIREGTRSAPLLPGALDYLKAIGKEHCAVVSGIEQQELEGILRDCRLTEHFYGVWGGPRTKVVLLRDLWCCGALPAPAVYYGDTRDDYESAVKNHLDFVFVSGVSEFEGWQQFFDGKPVITIKDFVQPKPSLHTVDANGFVTVNGETLFLGKAMAGARITG